VLPVDQRNASFFNASLPGPLPSAAELQVSFHLEHPDATAKVNSVMDMPGGALVVQLTLTSADRATRFVRCLLTPIHGDTLPPIALDSTPPPVYVQGTNRRLSYAFRDRSLSPVVLCCYVPARVATGSVIGDAAGAVCTSDGNCGNGLDGTRGVWTLSLPQDGWYTLNITTLQTGFATSTSPLVAATTTWDVVVHGDASADPVPPPTFLHTPDAVLIVGTPAAYWVAPPAAAGSTFTDEHAPVVQCQMDGVADGAWRVCGGYGYTAGWFNVTDLPPGDHTMHARQSLGGVTLSTTLTTHTFTVITVVDPPVVVAPHPEDLVPKPLPWRVHTARPPADATLRCALDGVRLPNERCALAWGDDSADGAGGLEVVAGLGNHTLVLQHVDGSGLSSMLVELAWRVWAQDATVVLTEQPVVITRSTHATFVADFVLDSGHPCGEACVAKTCTVSFDHAGVAAGTAQACGNAATGRAEATYSNIPNGQHVFNVSAWDQDTNTTISATYAVSLWYWCMCVSHRGFVQLPLWLRCCLLTRSWRLFGVPDGNGTCVQGSWCL